MNDEERENLRRSCELIASLMYEVRYKELPEASWPYWLGLVERWAQEIADGGEVRDINDMDEEDRRA